MCSPRCTEFCEKVRDARYDEITLPYNRETLMRWDEGNHPVPDEWAKFAKAVDGNGKVIKDVAAATAQGIKVYEPTSLRQDTGAKARL